MRKIDVVTTYIKQKFFFWKPNTWFGYLLRAIVFLTLLALFILLFWLPQEEGNAPEPLPEPPTPIPHTGDVQILLSWSDVNDLDLCCEDPYGEKIDYQHKESNSGGRLDVDMNAGSPYSQTPIENIYWPTGGAPDGKYKVYITFYKQNSEFNSSSAFKVIVKYNDKSEEYTGSISQGQKDILICSFTVE